MVIHVYYGGRGLVDDPTLTVLEKMQAVFEELRVDFKKFNLYEYKNTIPTLPQTLKEADGVILASTVEWYGMGGYLLQFLDACWQFGDKEKIAGIYMMPIVMSRTNGEREVMAELNTAWECLGGKLHAGLCAYVENTIELEMNTKYIAAIEKIAENFYRGVNQKEVTFPSSNQLVKTKLVNPSSIPLSPQESEQLSEFVSDEEYVQKQKEDLQELASMFKGKLRSEDAASEEEYLAPLRKAFHPQAHVAGSFALKIEGKKQDLVIRIAGTTLSVGYGKLEKPDIEMELDRPVMDKIISGRMTFQRAFMSGEMKKMRGDFRIMSGLDQVFVFEEK
ncbi:MAG: SCP2 sterol-binding domain-containing protein [Lachnospiraceae bacterium]|nr:SCP2 sterol-binding domain-containing protein [Lachnospiraceae bacterium]